MECHSRPGNGRASAGTQPKNLKACPCCKLAYEEFLASGKLGCPRCYAAFRTGLETLFQTRYGCKGYAASSEFRPKGKKTAKLPFNSEALKQELRLAVKREDFERASLLRDILQQHIETR